MNIYFYFQSVPEPQEFKVELPSVFLESEWNQNQLNNHWSEKPMQISESIKLNTNTGNDSVFPDPLPNQPEVKMEIDTNLISENSFPKNVVSTNDISMVNTLPLSTMETFSVPQTISSLPSNEMCATTDVMKNTSLTTHTVPSYTPITNNASKIITTKSKSKSFSKESSNR